MIRELDSVPFNQTEQSSKEPYKTEDFTGRRGQKKEISGKEWVVSGEVPFLWGKMWSVRQMTSLSPTRRSQTDW